MAESVTKWRPLRKKQTEDNTYWVQVWRHVEEVISKDQVGERLQETVEHVERVCRGKRVGYGWSGGKDSQALKAVMDRAGIKDCVMGLSAEMEYPAFLTWVEDHKPEKLQFVENPSLTLEWLGQHEDMLFPLESSTAAKWFKLIQHRAQDMFCKEHNLDLIILGRRRADGNYLGKDLIYTNVRGITRYSPIGLWAHEDVMGLCHYYDYPLSEIYQWPNGWVVGTGAWPARQWTGDPTRMQGWYETYLVDPKLVERAAKHVGSAAQFLQDYEAGAVQLVREYELEDGYWLAA